MTQIPQDRLIRKEVSLGAIRELAPPEGHIGLARFAPMKDVQSDDVIFEYLKEVGTGLAPARAEDSEAEMAQKDSSMAEGRASIIDWSLKDHYSASDVSRYRESVYIAGQLGTSLPLAFTGQMREGFEEQMARDTLLRRRKLDNRLEWLIWKALEDGEISYNDGKIIFTVDYDRPADQTNASVIPWTEAADANPIQDILDMQELMYDEKGVNISRAIISRKAFRRAYRSERFANDLIGSNPLYTVKNFGPDVAMQIIAEQTGVEFEIFDSVYRTKPFGSNTVTSHRFFSEDKVLFLPAQSDVDAIDDAIGFGATLTSPHPEGNWTSGFYEWEKDTGPDPWGHDRGNGIKAFPVFPHLDMTYVMKVLAD